MAKRTERLKLPEQLRTDEGMARRIRARADLSHRSIGQEIIFLLTAGLEYEGLRERNGINAEPRHLLSPSRAFAPVVSPEEGAAA